MADVVIPDMTAAPRMAVQNQPQAPNILGMAGQALQLRGLQNNLTKFNAEQAAGQDFQGAINPLTGQLDSAALNQRLANDPQAALAAPQMSQQGLANMQTQLQNQGISQHNAIERITWTGNATGALLSKPDVTRSDVIDTLTQGVADGVMPAKDAASVVATIPENGPQLQAWLRTHYAAAQASIQALQPHVTIGNDGKYQFGYNTNPVAGPVGPMPGTAFQNQLSPAQAAQPVTLPTPSGAGQVTTLGGVAQAASGGGAPPIIATGPTTQQQAANQTVGAAQGNQAASFVSESTNLAQTRAALQGMRVEMQTANGGPLADTFRNVGAALGELGISGMDQANAYDLLQKGQAQVVVSRVADGLGVPTDGKMAALAAQTPGAHMTGTAGAVAVGQIQGVLDYQLARAKAAQEAGVTQNPAQSSQFNLQWQQRYPNASVFQFPYLPREYQQKYYHSMTPAQQAQFKSQYRDAAQAGFVTPNPFSAQ